MAKLEAAEKERDALRAAVRHEADCVEACKSEIDALRAKLTLTSTRRDRPETVSLLYPLAVGNLLTACMNLAAEIGVPTVTADVVKGV